MHMRRCTHRPPMRRQSSQPELEGSTSATWSRCVQVSAIEASYRADRELHPADADGAFAAGARQRQAATSDAFVARIHRRYEAHVLARGVEMHDVVEEPRARAED